MLICNIGNQHFGSLDRAKELIKIAHECGADLIKSYAISFQECDPNKRTYYEMCSFGYDEYLELLEYAREVGNDLFFEITGQVHQSLLFHQQWRSLTYYDFNKTGTFVSDIDKDSSIAFLGNELFPPNLMKANIIHSLDKLSNDPNLERINILKKIYNRNIGYADKTIGIDSCLKANDVYNCTIIEKHLTLEKGVLFNGKPIEETIYSVLPKEFERLSNSLMVFKEDLILH